MSLSEWRLMLPREHGAYGQLIFPLVTSLAVAGMNIPAALIAFAAVAAFLSHEPFTILAGVRGVRARREHGREARFALAVTLVVALMSMGLAFWRMAPGTKWSLLVPLVPAALVSAAIARHREKTIAGEIMIAIAFAALAVPITLTGASMRAGVSIALVFAVVFAAGIIAVHAVIDAVRRGGPQFAWGRRAATLLVVAAALAGFAAAVAVGALPPGAIIAALPGLFAAAAVAANPRQTSRLRTIGWSLLASSALTALILSVSL